MDDAEIPALVRAAASGEASAWEALVRRFSGLVWSVTRAHGLPPPDAEDVYQVTWLRFAQHIDRIKEPDRLAGWLAATARNESMRTSRMAVRVTPTADLEPMLPPITTDTPEHAALRAESEAEAQRRSRQLWHAFEELSARCRELLRTMMATPPLSYAEIASLFDMPVGSIGPTRARCLQRLRGLMRQRGITGAAEAS